MKIKNRQAFEKAQSWSELATARSNMTRHQRNIAWDAAMLKLRAAYDFQPA